MKDALALLFLSIGACSDEQQTSRAEAKQITVTRSVPSHPAQRDSYSCGGETDLATVERYFSDLEKALAQPSPTSRFNRFIGPRFAVTDSRGHITYFYVGDVPSVTPGRITIQDWQEIHRRGERSLHNAGYRGCFMDRGKVWFEASAEHGFRLVGIAKNMRWVPLANGDSIH